MKIGIITFHAAMNYGSVLQAFALQEYLRSRGNDVRIIDFRSAAQRRLYPGPISFSSLYNTKRTLHRLLCGWKEIRFMSEKQAGFRAFASGRLRLTDKCFRTESCLRSYDWSGFDMLVSGSDQIWNLSAIDFSKAYFLNFTERVRKVAYAPSAGPHPHVSGSVQDNSTSASGILRSPMSGVRDLLSCYEAISVREKSTADFLSLGDVPVLPDPVLLHGADFYRAVMPGALKLPSDSNATGLHDAGGSLTEKERYVLLYSPGKRNRAAEMLADAVSSGMLGKNSAAVLPEDRRMPVFRVTDGASAGQYAGPDVLPCGPDGFLSLVAGSACTVGTSFHLMVFSMLFARDFWCPDAASDSRKIRLLTAAGLDPGSTFFPFSRPEIQSRLSSALAGMRQNADKFWTSLGV